MRHQNPRLLAQCQWPGVFSLAPRFLTDERFCLMLGGYSAPRARPMSIRFTCPSCQSMLRISDSAAGKRGKCPYCKGVIEVPAPAQLPAPVAEPIAEVLPVEQPIMDALPAGPILDPTRRFFLCRCEYCSRDLRVPVYEAGRVLRCPSCRLSFLAPGRLQGDGNTGLPVVVNVSALIVTWPLKCCCCLRPHDTFLPVSHTRFDWSGGLLHGLSSAETQGWNVPYCWECAEHVQRRHPQLLKRTCCPSYQAIRYDGWRASVHVLAFFNFMYANQFIVHNDGKCLLV